MTNNQLDIIEGSLLGDGYLVKHGRSANARFRFKQCMAHEEYVAYLYDQLSGYVACGVKTERSRKPSRFNGKITHAIEHWNGQYCYSASFWTKAHPVFEDMWRRWYNNGRKVVPPDLVLTPVKLAHWYAQDGTNNVCKSTKGFTLFTNSFTENEVDHLIAKLKDFNLMAKRYSGPIIRIMAGSYFDFAELVRPHLGFHCFAKKIDVSRAPKDRKGESWLGPKLTIETATRIRSLHAAGDYKLKDLAQMFGVTSGTIGKIVNNQMYKKPLAITGNAEVKAVYHYGYQG